MIPAVLDCRQNLPIHSKPLQSASMKPASSDTAQTSFLLSDLEKQLNPRSLLYRLAQAIDWKGFEKTFGSLYSTEGRPALPIRRMVGPRILEFSSRQSFAIICSPRGTKWKWGGGMPMRWTLLPRKTVCELISKWRICFRMKRRLRGKFDPCGRLTTINRA